MQNALGTCAILAVLAGGFSLTGDLGWLLRRGMRVIQATDVPPAAPQPAVTASAPVAAPARTAAPPATSLPSAAARRLPPGGPEAVDVSMLDPGTRIVVWLGSPGRSVSDPAKAIAFDVVDPAARETLMSEPQWQAHEGAAVAPDPPRRVLIRGSGLAGAIVRGGMVDVEPRGIAGGSGRELVGPVIALDVQR